MRKILATVLAFLLLLSVAPFSAYAADKISVLIKGQSVVFDGTEPVIIDGRTLVPIRGVFETLGFEVEWRPETQEAVLSNEDRIIIIGIGKDVFTTDGASYHLDVPAQIIGGRTMVPLRAILESVGYSLTWDGETSTIFITQGGIESNQPTSGPSDPEKRTVDDIQYYEEYPDIIDFGWYGESVIVHQSTERYEEDGALGYLYYVNIGRLDDPFKTMMNYTSSLIRFSEMELVGARVFDEEAPKYAAVLRKGDFEFNILAYPMSQYYMVVIVTMGNV